MDTLALQPGLAGVVVVGFACCWLASAIGDGVRLMVRQFNGGDAGV